VSLGPAGLWDHRGSSPTRSRAGVAPPLVTRGRDSAWLAPCRMPVTAPATAPRGWPVLEVVVLYAHTPASLLRLGLQSTVVPVGGCQGQRQVEELVVRGRGQIDDLGEPRVWNAEARQPVARVRLNAIAASTSQAELAWNEPEGR